MKLNTSILLVNPPYIKEIYKKLSASRPPLGLAYVAASLEQAGFKVEILDADAELLSCEETAERIIRSSAKYVGFTSVTATIPLVYEISYLVKAKDVKKIIFVGGIHVTFTADQTLKDCPAIDFVVRGEGEVTAPEVIKNLEKGEDICKIKGVTFRKGEEIITNPDREFIEDINNIPLPARHLLPIHLYSPWFLQNMGFRGRECASIITARGCPNRCVFCSSPFFWKRVRIRTPESVVSEIEFLVNKYGAKHIDFLDDTLILSEERMERICRLILEKSLDIKWTCYARINHITFDLVKLMKRAGCGFIQIGVESGNQNILDKVSKNITLEQARKAAKIVKRAGIKLMCDFMIGLPGDTRETVNQTIEFAKELNADFAFFSITVPFPGTVLYDDYRRQRANFNVPVLTNGELQDLCSEAYYSFYYRPAFFRRILAWVIRNPYEIKNFYSLVKIQIGKELRKIFTK